MRCMDCRNYIHCKKVQKRDDALNVDCNEYMDFMLTDGVTSPKETAVVVQEKKKRGSPPKCNRRVCRNCGMGSSKRQMLKFAEKNIEELIPYVNNPRKNDAAVDSLVNAIKKFGFVNPIVINSENVILAGHTRLKAALKIGMKTVPCIIEDCLTEAQEKAYRLADNKVAEIAEWDKELLAQELADIQLIAQSEGEELKMEDFGFTMEDFGLEQKEIYTEEPFDDIEKQEIHYGVPYQGNKSRIADIIISILPKGNRLVDLFGGGGCITHCGMLANKWNEYLYNDINPMITTLFMDAIYGKYHDENRVITREDFEALKDSDPYVKYIWSFGNNGTGYLWGKDVEEIKCQACRVVLSKTKEQRRLEYIHFIKQLSRFDCSTLDRLQSVEQLQALTQLEALQRLEAININYQDYQYKEGDVVYCDIPYEQTGKKSCDDYGVHFDSLEFYEWAKTRPFQVFFSSYEISDDTFYKVKVKTIHSLIGTNTNSQTVNEYLYGNQPIQTKEGK